MAHRCGFYRALVANTNDPESRGRIKVICPQLWGTSETDWIWPVGSVPSVNLNDQVWIAFEAADEDHPLLVGAVKPGATGTTTAGDSYVYQQTVPAASATITHNLNRYPTVTTTDSYGDEVIGDVVYVDANTVTITFSAAFSWTAYFD